MNIRKRPVLTLGMMLVVLAGCRQKASNKPVVEAPGSAQPVVKAQPVTTVGTPMPAPVARVAPVTAIDASRARAATMSGLLADMPALERQYTQHLITLTNPFFEGRAPGTRGNVIAAEYIDFYMRQQIGLEPAFGTEEKLTDGTVVKTPWQTYRQTFRRGSEVVAKKQAMSVKLDQEKVFEPDRKPDPAFAAGVDFVPLAFSASAAASGELAFAGYAIADGPDGFKSFPADADLKDKVVMCLRFEPLNKQGKSVFTEDGSFSMASGLQIKVASLVQRGAKGVIVVNPPGVDDPRAGKLESLKTTAGMGVAQEVPVVMMSEAAADRLLSTQGASLWDMRRRADVGEFVMSWPSVKVAMEVELGREPIMTDNVAGLLRGRGSLANEYIIIGGHYDHVGYGLFGSRDVKGRGKIHVGADDNASGASGVMLAAEMMKKRYAELPADANLRSIIFVAFSAEESGLFGSIAFVRRCPVPAKSVIAMLNMDMIGRLRADRLEVDGVGTAAEWNAILDMAVPRAELNLKRGESGRGPSDHATFFGAGLPVLHFFTGLHQEYHMPSDQFQLINYSGAVRVVEFVCDVASHLAQRTEGLSFVNTKARSDVGMIMPDDPKDKPAPGPTEQRPSEPQNRMVPSAKPEATDRNSPAAGKDAPKAGDVKDAKDVKDVKGAPPNKEEEEPARPVRGSRVRFGIAPGDYAGNDGVLIGDVYPGTPAAAAGLKEGDKIVKWNATEIKSVEDWMPLLAAAKPGDKVKLVYLRGKDRKETEVLLKARDDAPRNE